MNRLNPWAVATALAVTAAIVYVACALAFALWPEGTLAFFNAWLHGVDLTMLRPVARIFSWGSFAYGLVSLAASMFLTGIVFVFCYNHCAVFFGKREL